MSNMDSPNNNNMVDERDDEEVQLPGFRFHPTDEELVGFYLRRKVDMKPISIELIKPIDIYKYDPWDLPKSSCTSGDKEWYFFCKRGRKYKNSIRPNRVTGSGFWKATGIDKPVHSQAGQNTINDNCIGLKKTLVYYRGSAGKGTKTDWMMHEFRLPSISNATPANISGNSDANTLQEAEIWTLCRIFKRNVSYRKYTPDWRELSTKRSHPNTDITNKSYKKCNSMEREANDHYIDFSAPKCHEEKKPVLMNHVNNYNIINNHDRSTTNLHVNQYNSMASINSAIINNINNNHNNNPCNMDYSMSSSLFLPDENEQLFSGYTNWDELRAVVEFAFDTPTV